jgi:hypothetical protein
MERISMKTALRRIVSGIFASGALASGQAAPYTNFIRQTQMPTGVQWDVSVEAVGEQLSALAINPGGARFDLWAIKSSPLTNYLIDTSYVGAYVPMAGVVIRSEDPYAAIPRTRADRPFYVDVTVKGLLTGETDPVASKSVKLLRHVQSYGVGGNGVGLNRTQATMLSQVVISTNCTQRLSYILTSVPGTDRTKVRGEERFSVFSLEDYQSPESQIASRYIQIWPVADGSISSGLVQDQTIRQLVPQITLTLNDLYPKSRTYAQVYQGEPRLGVVGTVVPGSVLVINTSVPKSQVLVLRGYDAIFNKDGRWTMEILTVTPFGTDRLSYVSFNLNRTIEVNGTFTTIE